MKKELDNLMSKIMEEDRNAIVVYTDTAADNEPVNIKAEICATEDMTLMMLLHMLCVAADVTDSTPAFLLDTLKRVCENNLEEIAKNMESLRKNRVDNTKPDSQS